MARSYWSAGLDQIGPSKSAAAKRELGQGGNYRRPRSIWEAASASATKRNRPITLAKPLPLHSDGLPHNAGEGEAS